LGNGNGRESGKELAVVARRIDKLRVTCRLTFWRDQLPRYFPPTLTLTLALDHSSQHFTPILYFPPTLPSRSSLAGLLPSLNLLSDRRLCDSSPNATDAQHGTRSHQPWEYWTSSPSPSDGLGIRSITSELLRFLRLPSPHCASPWPPLTKLSTPFTPRCFPTSTRSSCASTTNTSPILPRGQLTCPSCAQNTRCYTRMVQVQLPTVRASTIVKFPPTMAT
jgi:hypothetical protein